MITTVNEHVQIKPISKIAEDGIMATSEKNYDEKGVVVENYFSSWDGRTSAPILATGMIVYFDSWQAAKFNEDSTEEFWLVPFSAIRAYEIPEK